MELTKTGIYTEFFTDEERKQFIGDMLAKMRKLAKLSQKEVAATIGISQATYSTYERGRSEPPAEILVRLSHLYMCPVDLLVQRDRVDKDIEVSNAKLQAVKKQIADLEETVQNLNDQALKDTALIEIGILKKLVATWDESLESIQKLIESIDSK